MANDINLGFSVTHDHMKEFMDALKEMQSQSVMAGFPQEEPARENKDGNPAPITNAALGYVHNNGSPEQNIPARPFMVEGIENKREPIVDGMEAAGMAALDGDKDGVTSALHAVGLSAQAGIRTKIVDGPFEPLAESTLKNYARQGAKGAQAELDSREAGNDPNPDNVRPLNRTGQMRNAVNYVIRKE